MFDIGGWEFLLIVVLAIVIIGPKELPGMLRTLSYWIGRARALANEFRAGLDAMVEETGVRDVQQSIRDEVTSAVGDDPAGVNTIRKDIERALDPEHGAGGYDYREEHEDDWASDDAIDGIAEADVDPDALEDAADIADREAEEVEGPDADPAKRRD